MNIKTKLENEPILFRNMENTKSKAAKLRELNKRGIYTVQDLIKSEENGKIKSRTYTAMANVFKHEYQGALLPYDEILNRNYLVENEIRYIAQDLVMLGISSYENACISYIWDNLKTYSFDTVSMEYVLNNFYAHRNVLAKYYVNYLNKEKENILSNDLLLEKANLEGQLEALQIVIGEVNKRIDQSPSPMLINYRDWLHITALDVQNKLASLDSNQRTRSNN